MNRYRPQEDAAIECLLGSFNRENEYADPISHKKKWRRNK